MQATYTPTNKKKRQYTYFNLVIIQGVPKLAKAQTLDLVDHSVPIK